MHVIAVLCTSLSEIMFEGPMKKNKGHQCENCDKAFSRMPKLIVHKRTFHQKLKDFTCDYCSTSNTYSSAQILKKHISTVHPNIDQSFTSKKYKCEVCSKVFPFDGSLILHVLLVHKKEQ